MAFEDITVEESKGALIVKATKSVTKTDSIVATAEQLQSAIDNLNQQIAEYQTLLDAINASPIVVTPLTP